MSQEVYLFSNAADVQPPTWNNPVLAHIHVPKTGGSSFRKMLIDHFGDAHLALYVDDTFFVYSEEEIAEHLSNNSIRAFSSHFVRTFPKSLAGRDLLYICFIRNPVEQFISHMTYMRKWFHGLREAAMLSCLPPNMLSLSLRETARWILTCERDIRFRENDITNFFARFPFRARYGSAAPEALYRQKRLAIAKEVLKSFFFVGVTEQMDRSVTLLQALAREHGLDLPRGKIPFENTSFEQRDDLTWLREDDEVGALLFDAVREDQQLYAWALARFDALAKSQLDSYENPRNFSPTHDLLQPERRAI